ncbi:MAG TPA: hypothetical protein VNK52_14285 [Hyphomicrobiaceae bacterium]|nr:hypothetical protein [Hyphomicrobiaceae bacterium]
MSKRTDSMRVPDTHGERWTCRNCGQPMQRWRHADGWTPPKDRGWYLYWFECLTPTCRTRQVMPKEAYVRPGAKPDGDTSSAGTSPFEGEHLLCAEHIQRLTHFRAI